MRRRRSIRPKTLKNTKRRRSTVVPTEEIDVITENTKIGYDEGEQRTEVHCPPSPPFSQKIRKMHYVCKDIDDIIHKYETLNVKKVNS